jgi:hypothetical protein
MVTGAVLRRQTKPPLPDMPISSEGVLLWREISLNSLLIGHIGEAIPPYATTSVLTPAQQNGVSGRGLAYKTNQRPLTKQAGTESGTMV